MGKILERYILREVVVTSLLVTAVLLVVLLANQVAVVLERAAVNQFPQSVVLQLIWLGALQNLTILIPVGLLLGMVLAFGRLYHDSEMAAALACGFSPASIYRSVALLAVLVVALLAWLTLELAPDATARTLSLRGAAAQRLSTPRMSTRTAPWEMFSWSATAARASRLRLPNEHATQSPRTERYTPSPFTTGSVLKGFPVRLNFAWFASPST